ncbi:MAG: hypothetical protein R3320_10035, partial [Nitriliruptorales bacterium]|nr:hypothetical protein [Nitriliruptorales bacterium]
QLWDGSDDPTPGDPDADAILEELDGLVGEAEEFVPSDEAVDDASGDVLDEDEDLTEYPRGDDEPETSQEPEVAEAPERLREPERVEPTLQPPSHTSTGMEDRVEPGPSSATPSAPSADDIVERMHAPPPGEEPEEQRGGLFKFRRRKEVPPRAEKALVRRIARTLPAVQEVLYLLEDAPEVMDDLAIVEATLAEVVAQFDPVTAAVWWPNRQAQTFGALASHGLTKAEQNLRVPISQPLFNELWHSGGGVLIQPTDMAQAAVAGIGGARTEAFMGSAVSIAGTAYAIVTVGSDEFSSKQLDGLNRIASDAAPGLAIAGLLQELRAGLT